MSFFRRSFSRTEEASKLRSSSLPPEADESSMSMATSSFHGSSTMTTTSTTSTSTTTISRGRSANPIGLSRRRNSEFRSSSKQNFSNNGRSQSLTRVLSSNNSNSSSSFTNNSSFNNATAGGGGGKLKRADSLASVTSAASTAGSDIFEPGWFAHAFHGSGTCNCGKEHEGRSCEEVWRENNKDDDNDDDGGDNGSNDEIDSNNDDNNNNNDGDGVNNVDGDDTVAEMTNVTESASGNGSSAYFWGNDISSSSSSSSAAMMDGGTATKNGTLATEPSAETKPPSKEEESYDASTITSAASGYGRKDNNTLGSSPTGSSSPQTTRRTSRMGRGGTSSFTSGADSGTIVANDGDGVNSDNFGEEGENSTVTSFTARDRSIQSELLGESSAAAAASKAARYRPMQANRNISTPTIHAYQQNDNDISSVTMDYLPTAALTGNSKQKSKSIVSKVKNKTYDKVKKKMKGCGLGDSNDDFGKSENSMGSQGTAKTNDSKKGRERGRSLGFITSRHSDARKGESLGLKTRRFPEGRKGGYGGRSRRSNSLSRRAPVDLDDDASDDENDAGIPQDRLDKRRDRRVRQRSRSIVKDARSLINMIDKQGSGDAAAARSKSDGGESLATEESIESHASTVIAGASSRGLGRNESSKDRRAFRDRDRARRSSDASGDGSERTAAKATIRTLQEQVTDLTNERNTLRNNSERMMDITTKQKSELENELRVERQGFAVAGHSQKREIEELKSKLQKMTLRLSETESKYDSQIQQLKSDNESVRSQADEWKTKHDRLDEQHHDLLEEREAEAAAVTSLENKLEGCRVVIETMKKEDVERKNKTASDAAVVNDDLVEKIGDLVDENGRLQSECQRLRRDLTEAKASSEASVQELSQDLRSERKRSGEVSAAIETLRTVNFDLRATFVNQGKKSNRRMRSLLRSLRSSLGTAATASVPDLPATDQSSRPVVEMEHAEALSLVRDLQAEGEALQESMDDTIRTASNWIEETTDLVKSHESTAREYESRLKRSQEDQNELRSREDGLSSQLDTLRRENKTLSAELEDANILVVSSVRNEIETERASKESSAWRREKRELFTANDGLRKENDGLRKENENLHGSLKEMNTLVATAEEAVSKLSEEKNEKLELATSNDDLRKENEKLHGSLKEMNALVTTAEECVVKLSAENATLKDAQQDHNEQLEELDVEREANKYLRGEIKNVSSEKDEAYDTCKVLQQEINMLQLSLKESKIRVEKLNEDTASVSSASLLSKESQEKLTDKLAELTKKNESLTSELEQKNYALQIVQSALETLKVEQSTIRKTIDELNAENERLRTSTPPPPSTPRSPGLTSSQRHHTSQGSDGSQVIKLEKGIKRREKENKGLREANSTLSSKLFDEMEKTDALRVANEGLAARICKLVAFIQQNPGANGGGGGSVSSREQGGGSSSSRNGGSKGKGKGKGKVPPPGPPKRNKSSFHK